MYIGEDETSRKESPIIIDGESEEIEKAKRYYAARDYVASGVFIRKAIEKLIVNLLPQELYLKPDGKFVPLQTLWKKLLLFYSNNNIEIKPDTVLLFKNSKL